MNEDREEIRWKLKNLHDMIDSSLEGHQKESEDFKNDWRELSTAFIHGRNTIIGGIGFGILLLISLISIEVIGNENTLYIPISIVVIIGIFLGINLYLNWLGKKYFELDEEYTKQILELLEFQGWMLGHSMREDIKFERIILLLYFVVAFGKASSYQLKYKAYNIFGGVEPDQSEFLEAYEIAKKNLQMFEPINVKAVKRIKSFVQDFESHKKEKEST